MKTFLILTIILTIFTNCSEKNAFSNFNITPNQEKSEDSLQSSKLFNHDTMQGIVSAVYLNSVMPKEYNDKEYFYIYVYTKNPNEKLEFFLNGIEANSIKELKVKNKFSNLTSFAGKWQKYYLVSFDTQGDKLSLITKSSKVSENEFSSKPMLFQKDD